MALLDSLKSLVNSAAGGLLVTLLKGIGKAYTEEQAQDLMDSLRIRGWTHTLKPADVSPEDAIEVVVGPRLRVKDDDVEGTALYADTAVKQVQCLAEFVQFAGKAAKHVLKHSGPYKGV